jgi:hypothetical protein
VTLSDAITKVKPNVTLVLLAALVVVSALLFHQCSETAKVKAAAAKADERVKLLAGQVQVATERDISKDAEILALQAKVKAATGRVGIPTIVVSGTTGPVTVGGETLGASSSTPPRTAQGSGADGESSAPGPASCVLARGSKAEIRTHVVGVETEGGNLAVSGTADAYRLNPAINPVAPQTETHLFGGPLRLDVAIPESSPPPASQHGWGLGAAVALNGGLAGRVVVLPPPICGLETFGSVDVSRNGTVDRPAIGIFRRF